jgi:hypothetical protein
LGITKATEYRAKGVPWLGLMGFTCTVEVFDGQEVVSKHACSTPHATCVEAVADVDWQTLMSWKRSWHHDLKESIYALYPRRKKDAFKISRVDSQIFRGAMSHSMSFSMDLSDYMLTTQRLIRYLRTRLLNIEDTLRARQRMKVG